VTIVKLGYERFSQITASIDANAAVLKGALCASFGGGNGYAKTATATPGIVFLGRAKEACDNTGGAAAALEFDINLEREVFAWKLKNDATNPVGATNLYGPVYLSAANTVTPNSGLLTSLITRITDVRAMLVAHAAGTGTYHGAADPASYTIAIPTTEATVYTSLGQLKTAGIAHAPITASSVHGGIDFATVGALSSLVVPSTLEGARVFIEQFASIFFGASGHTTRTTDSIHGAADATNVLTSTAAVATNPYFGRAWFIDSKTGLVVVEPLEA
jgi:hypothetical protein